ncbi:36968_t:CDS:2, partial [Racocetra persica]
LGVSRKVRGIVQQFLWFIRVLGRKFPTPFLRAGKPNCKVPRGARLSVIRYRPNSLRFRNCKGLNDRFPYSTAKRLTRQTWLGVVVVVVNTTRYILVRTVLARFSSRVIFDCGTGRSSQAQFDKINRRENHRENSDENTEPNDTPNNDQKVNNNDDSGNNENEEKKKLTESEAEEEGGNGENTEKNDNKARQIVKKLTARQGKPKARKYHSDRPATGAERVAHYRTQRNGCEHSLIIF